MSMSPSKSPQTHYYPGPPTTAPPPQPHHQQSQVETEIRQLLDQQVNIQARLATLLAVQNGFNVSHELEMLRHKCRVLEELIQSSHREISIPTLSQIEEARALQYRCECLEVAGYEEAGVDLIEALKRSGSEGPCGFFSWLDQHLELYDPIIRAVSANRRFGKEPDGPTVSSPICSQPMSSFSHKCWNDGCIRYIYGFSTLADRDSHLRTHENTFSKKDSGISLSNTPPLRPPNLPSQHPSAEVTGQPGPVKLPRLTTSSNLPPLSPITHLEDKSDSSTSFGFHHSRRATIGGSESEIDPLLPPIKRTRVGNSRLQSIGELQLLRDNEPCLRCKVSHRAVRSPTDILLTMCVKGLIVTSVQFKSTMSLLLGASSLGSGRTLAGARMLQRLYCVACGLFVTR